MLFYALGLKQWDWGIILFNAYSPLKFFLDLQRVDGLICMN